jgi:hypothetical protein
MKEVLRADFVRIRVAVFFSRASIYVKIGIFGEEKCFFLTLRLPKKCAKSALKILYEGHIREGAP